MRTKHLGFQKSDPEQDRQTTDVINTISSRNILLLTYQLIFGLKVLTDYFDKKSSE